MTKIKWTKKSLLLSFVSLIIISGVFGIVREVFLKEYEEQCHFWISVLMGFFAVSLWMSIMIITQKFTEKTDK